MTQFIFNNELKYKLLYVIDIYLDNLCNSKNIYLIKPVFFYNGFNHNNLCLYTQKNLRENVLNYLDNRFNMNTRYLIWEKMYDDVFINNYTGIIRRTAPIPPPSDVIGEVRQKQNALPEEERTDIGTAPTFSQTITNQGTDLVNQMFSNQSGGSSNGGGFNFGSSKGDAIMDEDY